MMYGDVIYDGAILHTEDGDLEVVSASSTGLQLRTPHMFAQLRKVDAPPTVRVDFLFGRTSVRQAGAKVLDS
jgi:hypothetical protein